MFLNKTLLKKFIKSSFRTEGLLVGKIYGGIVVAGGTWIVWTEDGYIPNWLKAAVMEYTGELPKQECAFRAKKDEPIQYEIADDSLYDLPGIYRQCKSVYTVTPIVLSSKYNSLRLLQQDSTRRMLAIQEKYHEIIDLGELGDENAPGKPVSMNVDSNMLLYKNEHSAYAFAIIDGTSDVMRKIMGHVDSINFSEEEF